MGVGKSNGQEKAPESGPCPGGVDKGPSPFLQPLEGPPFPAGYPPPFLYPKHRWVRDEGASACGTAMPGAGGATSARSTALGHRSTAAPRVGPSYGPGREEGG